MSETRQKRIRRSPQERAAEMDGLIEKQNQLIKELESKKNGILSPKTAKKPRRTKKQKIQEILKEAQKQGMKPEEIAERLGLSPEEQR